MARRVHVVSLFYSSPSQPALMLETVVQAQILCVNFFPQACLATESHRAFRRLLG